ncbi:MAG: nuclear transport factor 2 family protein [Pseudomonadales bacterium]|nr:nuclear transport factor 2 family protein [Pseudomonadales bacterium]
MTISTAKLLDNFVDIYQCFDDSSIDRLPEIYSESLIFTDPVHQIEGLEPFQAYCSKLTKRCSNLGFECHEIISTDNRATITWHMHFNHPALAKGKALGVEGCTILTIDGKISRHRDYFDLGDMIYEHLPALGYMIRQTKKRLSK